MVALECTKDYIYNFASTHRPTIRRAHRVVAGRLLQTPRARARRQPRDSRPTYNAAQRQQTLRDGTLDGLDEAPTAHDAVAARRRLHRGPGINAYDAFIFLGRGRLGFAFFQLVEQFVLQRERQKSIRLFIHCKFKSKYNINRYYEALYF